ncbi:MAG: glycosyltransferase [Syntrophotaleaceae bacterium]
MDYYDFGLCGGLVAAEIETTLFTCDETRQSDAPFDSRHVFCGIYGRKSKLKRGLYYLLGLSRAFGGALAAKHNIIHLHLFHVGILEFLTCAFARLLGFKLVATVHDVEAFAQGLSRETFERCGYALAHRIIVHNRFSKQALVRRYEALEPRISIIPHGNYLDAVPKLIDPLIGRERLGVTAEAQILLFFGQIKRVKGLDVLLDAMALVAEKHPRALLVIAGKVWKR